MALARGDLLLLVTVLAAVGTADAAYLTYEWYAAAGASWCDVSEYFSCTKVRESPWSAVGGIPTATVGLVGFLVLLGLTVLALRGVDSVWRWSTDRWILMFAATGALIGLGLTLIEILVIHAVCILCAFGFALDLGILVLAVLLLRRVE